MPSLLRKIDCAHHDDTEWEHRDGLLELDAAIHRDQDIVLAAHAVQEVAVLDAGPSAANYGVNIMAAEF